jgi:hypothetical protein
MSTSNNRSQKRGAAKAALKESPKEIDVSLEDVNKAIGERLDAIAYADSQYQRLMGMRDILLKLEGSNVEVPEVPATGGSDSGGEEG